MSAEDMHWKATLVRCLALASKLEGEGQYNNAKLLRAAADSMSRQATYSLTLPSSMAGLAAEILQTADALAALEVDPGLLAALKRGANALSEGRLPLIQETPNAFVCRTCGHVTLIEPAGLCPVCGAWPGTFQLFLPVYWLNALEPLAALERLRQTPKEVEGLLDGFSDMELNRLPADGGWAIRNTLSHLRDAQGLINVRVDLFLQEEHPVLESKAVFAWATDEADRPPSAREIFDTYLSSREAMLNKLSHIPFDNWYRTGQHEEFGSVTLRQQVSYFAAHELTHLPQIERLRREILRG